jgi:DNA-directed RNA polymerase specialized sigma24 family protein
LGDDNTAFLEATLPAMDLVYNLARRCMLPGSDVEDLVQETYLHALVGWRAHRRPDRVGAWLATICLNLARSDYRRRQRRPTEVLAADPGGDGASTVDPAGQALGRLQSSASPSPCATSAVSAPPRRRASRDAPAGRCSPECIEAARPWLQRWPRR